MNRDFETQPEPTIHPSYGGTGGGTYKIDTDSIIDDAYEAYSMLVLAHDQNDVHRLEEAASRLRAALNATEQELQAVLQAAKAPRLVPVDYDGNLIPGAYLGGGCGLGVKAHNVGAVVAFVTDENGRNGVYWYDPDFKINAKAHYIRRTPGNGITWEKVEKVY